MHQLPGCFWLPSLVMVLVLAGQPALVIANDELASSTESSIDTDIISNSDISEVEASDSNQNEATSTESTIATTTVPTVTDESVVSPTEPEPNTTSETTVTDNPATTSAAVATSSNPVSLLELSREWFGLFKAEQLTTLPPATEIIVVYDLDKPIVVPVKSMMAVVVDEPAEVDQSTSKLDRVIDTVGDWLFGTKDNTGSTTMSETATTTDETILPPVPIELTPPVADTNSNSEAPVDSVIKITPEIDNQPTTVESAPVSWGKRLWQYLVPLAWAEDTIEIETGSTTDSEATTTSESSEATLTTATTITTTATTTSVATESATTSTPGNTEAGEIIFDSTVISSSTPLVQLGTTSISGAVLETNEDGTYQVIIMPGSLPLGIHELQIATTTSVGEINERVVVDIGGGKVRFYPISDQERFVIVTDEDGKESLWLEVTALATMTYNYKLIAGPDLLQTASPLTFFDDMLFYLDASGLAIRTYELVSGLHSSFSREGDRSVVVTLPSGVYYLHPAETDFQFVSYSKVY